MALTKFASALTLDYWRASDELIGKTGHRHQFKYTPRKGYIYVRSRAISSRMNDNFDLFPAEEIRKAWRTFIGKPVFVNHRNEDPTRARGVIIDAALHEDVNPDGTPDVWVELLHEIDAVRFPKLAKAILKGEVDRTSMGTNVEHSQCTACGNIAVTPADYCAHIPRLKGMKLRRKRASGDGYEEVVIAEKCVGLSFFENSVLVEDPADPTAFFLGVDDHSGLQTAATRQAILLHDRPWTEEDEAKHPRKGDGEFTEKGNEGADSSEPTSKKTPAEGPAEGSAADAPASSTKWQSPNTTGTGSKADPISTDSVEDAARALIQGNHVELTQPKQVCTLVDRLAEEVKKAKDSGSKLAINLCNVTAKGTSLFCVEAKGIPRIKMPQLKSKVATPGSRVTQEMQPNEYGEYDLQPAFLQSLREDGTRTSDTDVLAAHLKATQSELNTEKVASMMDRILGGGTIGEEPIFVSNDDYIVDGHHRWAATIAADFEDGKTDQLTLPVHVIDMDIITLLAKANKFAGDYGLPSQTAAATRQVLASMVRQAIENPTLYPDGYWGDEDFTLSGAPVWLADGNQATPRLVASRVRNATTDRAKRSKWYYEITLGDETVSAGFVSSKEEAEARFRERFRVSTAASRHAALVQPPPDVLGWVQTLNWYIDYNHGKTAPGSRFVDPDAYSYSDIAYGINRARNRGSGLLDEALARMTRTEIVALVNRIHDEMPLSTISQGAVEHWVYDHADEIIGPRLEGGNGQGTMHFPTGSRKVAFGEQVAPAEVDTLREEECPVCGSNESYNGEKCLVCGYLTPPDMFQDPDLEKAQEVNLRQDDAASGAPAPAEEALECNTCGATFGGGEDAVGDADPALADDPAAEVDPAAVDPDADPEAEVDPEAAEPNADGMDLAPGDPAKKFPEGTHDEDDPDAKAVTDDDDDDEKEDDEDPKAKKKPPFKPKGAKIDPFERLQEADSTDVAPEIGLKAGDSCPKCGEGTLEGAGTDPGAEPVEDGPTPDQGSIEDARVGARRGSHMGPTLAAVAAQQKRLDAQDAAILAIARLAGLEQHPTVVALQHIADAENPAQPEPEPSSESAVLVPSIPQGTTEVTTPGASPVTDVAPDATTSLTDPGGVLTDVGPDATADVQAPITGTQEGADNTVETEVVSETGDNKSTMFPLEGGPFAQKASALRQIASMRLARLRIQAGTAQSEDDLTLAAAIATSDMSDHDIESEVATLAKVTKVQATRQRTASAPRTAGVRSTPSMAGMPQVVAAEGSIEDDAFLLV